MAVVSLVLGILGLILFCWAGPGLGTLWVTAVSAGSLLQGQMTITTWPIWVCGLAIGVGLPLLGVILGIAGLKKEDSKGISIGGIVLGVVAALIGGALTFAAYGGATIASTMNLAENDEFQQLQKQLQDQLNDPALQQQIQQQIQKARQAQQAQQGQAPVQPTQNVPLQPAQPVPAQPAQPVPAQPDQPDQVPVQPQ
jgi:hypothetical protein